MNTTPDPVWRTALSGAQILFVAFGATVLVPLLTGLNPSLALLGAGVGTLIFQLCTKRQVPIYLGSSFAFIAPVIYSVQTWGMPATLGALASASFFYYVAAALVKWRGVGLIHRLLPPVVIGPVVMVIGLGLAQVAVGMATGKAGEAQVVPYGTAIAIAAISLLATMLTAIRARGLLKLVPILIGVAVGYAVSLLLGIVDFSKVSNAAWIALPEFGSPEFNLAAILFMIPVAIAPIVEHRIERYVFVRKTRFFRKRILSDVKDRFAAPCLPVGQDAGQHLVGIQISVAVAVIQLAENLRSVTVHRFDASVGRLQ